MVQAGLPGRQHVVAAGPARAHRPVPGQGEADLLAQSREPLPGTFRPAGVGLVGQQFAVLGEGGGQPVVAVLAGRHRQPGAKGCGQDLGVDLDGRRHPDVPQVGRQQRGGRLAEVGERAAGHGQRLRQRPGGRARLEAREQLLARQVAADPPAWADEDELAQPPGARPRPRASDPAAGGDGELAEQPYLHGLRLSLSCWRLLCGSRGHVSIIPAGSDIPGRVFRACQAPSGGNTAGTAPA